MLPRGAEGRLLVVRQVEGVTAGGALPGLLSPQDWLSGLLLTSKL